VAGDSIHGFTPWSLSPNGVCQDNLEVGDVVENLSQEVHRIAMNGRTYHPQNVAGLPWFEFQYPSTALFGAYSYPDPEVIMGISPPGKSQLQAMTLAGTEWGHLFTPGVPLLSLTRRPRPTETRISSCPVP
jgi:hypothetical protein